LIAQSEQLGMRAFCAHPFFGVAAAASRR